MIEHLERIEAAGLDANERLYAHTIASQINYIDDCEERGDDREAMLEGLRGVVREAQQKTPMAGLAIEGLVLLLEESRSIGGARDSLEGQLAAVVGTREP